MSLYPVCTFNHMTGPFKCFIPCTSGGIEECFDNFHSNLSIVEGRKEKSQHSKMAFTMGEGTMWRSFCLAFAWTMMFFIFFLYFNLLPLSLPLSYASFLFFRPHKSPSCRLSTYMSKLYLVQVLTNKRIAYNWKDFRQPLFHHRHFYSTILFSSFEKVPARSKKAHVYELLTINLCLSFLRQFGTFALRPPAYSDWTWFSCSGINFSFRSWHTISMALNNFCLCRHRNGSSDREIREKNIYA